jgi:dihydrofolate reductase
MSILGRLVRVLAGDGIGSMMEHADALLLGRLTYEGFASSWPLRSGDAYTDEINSMPKYVASRTLTEATWNSSIIKGEVADEVAGLKANRAATF